MGIEREAKQGDADLLTRTPLRIDGRSASSVAALIAALHRVPGVLFAEVDQAGTNVIVAHDDAVPEAALVAAATKAGVPAEALAWAPTLPISAGHASPALRLVRVRNLLAIATGSYLALALFYVLRANGSENPWLYSAALLPLWVFLIAQTIRRRRR